MKINIATKLLIILLLTSLLPLSIAVAMGFSNNRNISQIASEANEEVGKLAMSDSTEALSQELKTHLKTLAESVAGDINEILVRVEADTAELADFAEFLYNQPEAVGTYPYPSVYGPGPDKRTFGSIEENENSWLAIFNSGVDESGQVSAELMEEIRLTEFMDIKFKSIAHSNPYAVQLYLNTPSQITRGMPFINGEYLWVNGPEQFQINNDVTEFDFYFLADAEHNPERQPVWTELYWDPAGLGWMVSCVAPAYQADEVKGVVGIDITLGKMIDDVINVQIEESGFAFLMSNSGQAIAFPERGADFLGFSGNLEGDFGNDEELSFFLTEANDPNFQAIIRKMLAGEHNLTTYTHPDNGQEYFFAFHPIELTHWSVGLIVPVEEVIAPAIATNEKITQNMDMTSQAITDRSQTLMTNFLYIAGGIVALLIPLALIFSRSISNPIKTLQTGSQKIGAGDLDHRISVTSGDEIETLADNFNQMADDLQAKIEEIEAANAELRKLDELKSQFISMASHELRTPLISIQGYIDLLRENHKNGFAANERKMLDTVARNTTRLARIVTELLDISKIEENKLVLRQETIHLPPIIHDIAEEHQPSLDKRGHTLNLNVQPDMPAIFGDRDRIAQVIINLLGNAIKYTPDGGHIEISAQAEGALIHLQVADNGIGIKKEDVGRLFQRFSTVHDVTKHKSGKDEFMAGGTGLGLSIVEGIVKAHGGKIWVESVYEEGTTFHITLPAVVEEQQQRPKTETNETLYRVTQFDTEISRSLSTTDRLKVLVIDDEEDVLDITAKVLEDQYEIVTAQTSATGIKQAITDKPDLILLDVWMPGISGYDVCKTLKRNSKTKETPVIIFTAATEKVNEERARGVGADGFVTKPFKKEDLISLIEGFRAKDPANEPG